jgi:hypothetical protein
MVEDRSRSMEEIRAKIAALRKRLEGLLERL